LFFRLKKLEVVSKKRAISVDVEQPSKKMRIQSDSDSSEVGQPSSSKKTKKKIESDSDSSSPEKTPTKDKEEDSDSSDDEMIIIKRSGKYFLRIMIKIKKTFDNTYFKFYQNSNSSIIVLNHHSSEIGITTF
jgi:hypothetical protein